MDRVKAGWLLVEITLTGQQRRGSVMFWNGIVNDEVVGPVPDGVNMTAHTYINYFEGMCKAMIQKEAKCLQKYNFYAQQWFITFVKEN